MMRGRSGLPHTCNDVCCHSTASSNHPQAPHIHFLLLEAADILQLHPLPKVYVLQAPTPFVRLLRIPLGSSPSSSSSSGGVLKCQRASVLVLSSAAMQLLAPAELQAAMSGALAPLALEGECVHGFQQWCLQGKNRSVSPSRLSGRWGGGNNT